MKTSVWINVYQRQDGGQQLGIARLSRQDAIDTAGPIRKFYFGLRPVYRLRVTMKDRSR